MTPERTFEAQWDEARGTVALTAASSYTDRYTVVVPAADRAAADKQFQDFKDMYLKMEEE